MSERKVLKDLSILKNENGMTNELKKRVKILLKYKNCDKIFISLTFLSSQKTTS